MKAAIAFLFLFCAPSWAINSATPDPPSPATSPPQETNKAIARRVFDEIFNQGKFQVADEVYAKDFVNHGLHKDADLAKDQSWARFEKQACPDLKLSFGPMIAEGDLVSVLWTARGTNTVRVGWIPATGARIEERGITIWRIRGGKIREEWSSFNELRIVREIIYQMRRKLVGIACVAFFLLWLVVRGISTLLFGRR